MARQAEADGIEVICATPHIRPDHEVTISELAERVSAINEELSRLGIAVRVVQGGELAEPIARTTSDENLREISLDRNGVWVLLEPSPGPLVQGTITAVEELAARGFRAIVAHPERHAGADFREQLAALVARGALIQVTAALIANGPAAPTMLEMAGEGLVHLLGSDAHSSHGGRPVRLSEGLGRLGEVPLVEPHLDWIASDGPAAILRGEAVTPPFAPP
jgi:tyrosine-protein phosphatase YwqE